MKILVQVTLTCQTAEGPDPYNNPYELLDADGDRVAYVDSPADGENEALKYVDPHGTLKAEVI